MGSSLVGIRHSIDLSMYSDPDEFGKVYVLMDDLYKTYSITELVANTCSHLYDDHFGRTGSDTFYDEIESLIGDHHGG